MNKNDLIMALEKADGGKENVKLCEFATSDNLDVSLVHLLSDTVEKIVQQGLKGVQLDETTELWVASTFVIQLPDRVPGYSP